MRIAASILSITLLAGPALAAHFGNFEVASTGEGAWAEARRVAGGGLRFGCDAGGAWRVIARTDKRLYAGARPVRPLELTLDVDDAREPPFRAPHKGNEAVLAGEEAARFVSALRLRGRAQLLLRASQGYERPLALRLEGVEDAVLALEQACGALPLTP